MESIEWQLQQAVTTLPTVSSRLAPAAASTLSSSTLDLAANWIWHWTLSRCTLDLASSVSRSQPAAAQWLPLITVILCYIIIYNVICYIVIHYIILYYTIPGTPPLLCGHSRRLWCSIAVATHPLAPLSYCQSRCAREIDHAGRCCCWNHHAALRHQEEEGVLEGEHGRAAEEAAPFSFFSGSLTSTGWAD